MVEKEVRWMRPGEGILLTQLLNAAHFHFFTHYLDDLSHKRLTFISDQNSLAFQILQTVAVEGTFSDRLRKYTVDGS